MLQHSWIHHGLLIANILNAKSCMTPLSASEVHGGLTVHFTPLEEHELH